ncbi:MAG: DUF1080 domain-containing protein, partial [Planctomycetaceae bacterium]|nr:DUF1080 domain-containing protein [Planctomycetaceae bacterium]
MKSAIWATVIGAVLGSALPLWAADNVLSQAEATAGWRLLFDGKTLTGWRNS